MKKLFLSGLAIMGFGFATVPMAAKAQQLTLPQGYTLSPTPINGKHCYYYGGKHANYYCYDHKLGSSARQPNSTNNNASSMPESAVKSPRSTIRPKHIVNSRRSRGGGH
jgi:hypothetical protein